jgi:hypothetical protein
MMMTASRDDRFDHRKALLVFAAFAFLPLLIVGSINYTVDPFQYFRNSGTERFSNAMQRYQAPGIVRNYPFDSIVVGSSHIANIRNWMFDRPEFAVKPKVVNLGFSAGTVLENSYVVELALRTKPIRTVYWSIGRQQARGFRIDDFPKCMYGGFYSFLPPYCYLFNAGVFWESYVDISHSKGSRADWLEGLEQWRTYSSRKMDPHARACEMRARAEGLDIDRETRTASFAPIADVQTEDYRELVLPIVRGNPGVRFVFFLSPEYLDSFWMEGVSGYPSSRQALFDVFLNEPNAEIHDLSLYSAVSHHLEFFVLDELHFDPEAARRVVAALADGGLRVKFPAEHERLLREELQAGAELMRSYAREKCP